MVGAAVAAAALGTAAAGCEAGAGAQTSRPYAPTDGASTVLHAISIRNVFVLGPALGQTIPAGGSAGMFLGLVNNGAPDQLRAVSAPGAAAVVRIPRPAVALGTNQPALLTGPVPRVILQGLTRPLKAGQWVPVTFYFQNAGLITINVPVVARASQYLTFSPPPSPTPTTARTGRPAPGAARTARTARPAPRATRTGTPRPSASP